MHGVESRQATPQRVLAHTNCADDRVLLWTCGAGDTEDSNSHDNIAALFQDGARNRDLKCVAHPSTLRCLVQNTSRIQNEKAERHWTHELPYVVSQTFQRVRGVLFLRQLRVQFACHGASLIPHCAGKPFPATAHAAATHSAHTATKSSQINY